MTRSRRCVVFLVWASSGCPQQLLPMIPSVSQTESEQATSQANSADDAPETESFSQDTLLLNQPVFLKYCTPDSVISLHLFVYIKMSPMFTISLGVEVTVKADNFYISKQSDHSVISVHKLDTFSQAKKGQNTVVFHNYQHFPLSNSFSILCGEQSLDFVCPTEQICNMLVSELNNNYIHKKIKIQAGLRFFVSFSVELYLYNR